MPFEMFRERYGSSGTIESVTMPSVKEADLMNQAEPAQLCCGPWRAGRRQSICGILHRAECLEGWCTGVRSVTLAKDVPG